MTLLLFVLAAAAATVLRVVVTSGAIPGEIPWRTLGVNTTGAFVLGVVVGAEWFASSSIAPVVVATAGLGSLTTFSTVAAETAGLHRDGHTDRAIAYVGLTVLAGVTAAWVGLSIGD